jgi:Alpha/beta hydrolase of unknown function (DUF900)
MYQLTARAREAGRGFAPIAPVPGTRDPATSGLDTWTIFVHGYNNNQVRAAATWGETAATLVEGGVHLDTVVLFFWPGDFFPSRKASALMYPRTVPIAHKTGERLATYLTRVARPRSRPLRIAFVAHSLGSLVVLETIRRLRVEKANVEVLDVLLMAAAVPEGFCLPSAPFGLRFKDNAREVVLFSEDDTVLEGFFEAGQQIAGAMPRVRTRAVGRTGGPSSGPGRRWFTNVNMYGFDHGHYWTKEESVAEIADVVQGVAGTPRAGTFGRELAAASITPDTVPWDLIDPHDPAQGDLILRCLNRPGR